MCHSNDGGGEGRRDTKGANRRAFILEVTLEIVGSYPHKACFLLNIKYVFVFFGVQHTRMPGNKATQLGVIKNL
jgi:hypothetical protein